VMKEDWQSLVIASDYRVPDPTRVPLLLESRKAALAEIGAHHVFVHASTIEPGRVLVSIVARNREPIVDLLRSRLFFEWFDAVGVTDIPAVFAGEIVEKIDIADAGSSAPPPVVVATMSSVGDVPTLIEHVHSAIDGFRAAGIRKVWVFRAFDDSHEVMILHQIDSEESAKRWIKHPEAAAEWMEGAGMGAYPPLFVGKLLHMMRIDENR
jgi:heme-degrading monooxygenase HmoA